MLLSKPKKIVLAMLVLGTWATLVQSVSANDYRTEQEVNQMMEDRYSIEEEVEEVEKEYLGQFTITFYCNCKICCGKWAGGKCANGEYPTENRTIAVDTDIIELNSEIHIEGFDNITFKAQDTGSAIKGKKLDIFCASHNKCLANGKLKNIKVYKIIK